MLLLPHWHLPASSREGVIPKQPRMLTIPLLSHFTYYLPPSCSGNTHLRIFKWPKDAYGPIWAITRTCLAKLRYDTTHSSIIEPSRRLPDNVQTRSKAHSFADSGNATVKLEGTKRHCHVDRNRVDELLLHTRSFPGVCVGEACAGLHESWSLQRRLLCHFP